MSTAAIIAPQDSEAVPAALPLVSVIIPVRNDARRLAHCLATLGAQDYPADSYEVIVVDNGSTDDSVAVARQAGAQVLCHPDLRVGALRNRGVAAAQGEILAFVDSDHEVPKGWLREAADQFLQSDFQQAIVGSPCLAPPGGTWVQTAWELHRIRERARREVAWLGAGNMFLRRADFELLGGFDEELVAAEDVDLCVRMTHQNGRIVSDMRVANIHHGEPPSLWQFFRKEYWRGSSGIRAFLAHGMPWHELPSLLYPLYYLIVLAILPLAAGYAGFTGKPWPLLWALTLLVLPALLLAIKTCWQVRRPLALVPLGALYFVYGLARAAALFKR